MNRTIEERMSAVQRLVSAARDLSRDAEREAALVETTGLSHQGIALALAEHLETSPSHDDIRRLVQGAGTASTVHVILSANVFTAALRALAVARAAAPR